MSNTLVKGPKHTLQKDENVVVATLDCQNMSKHCYTSMQSIFSIASRGAITSIDINSFFLVTFFFFRSNTFMPDQQ